MAPLYSSARKSQLGHKKPCREAEKKEKFKINQFNLLASEMISLNRSLQDVRLSQCKSKAELKRRIFEDLKIVEGMGKCDSL